MGTAPKNRRSRRRHAQQELPLRRDKNGQRRGVGPRTIRKGVRLGRPPKNTFRSAERHMRRPELDAKKPLHITLRVVDAVGYLRTPHLYRAIRGALLVAANRDDFRIVHFSMQRNHLHLLVEAADRRALWRGMQGFQISAARRINRELSRKLGKPRSGQVFADRYHVRVVSSVRQTRHALNYVLNNWRHHGARGMSLYDGKLDPYSSAIFFPGWKERTTPEIHIPAWYDPPTVSRPQTWLLAESWKRAQPISVWEVPGDVAEVAEPAA